jgi:hypothetical protein
MSAEKGWRRLTLTRALMTMFGGKIVYDTPHWAG